MLKLPADLEDVLFTECKESFVRGLEVRQKNVRNSALFLFLLIAILAVLDGMPGSIVVAVTVAASSLCVIWAFMSMSASLNAQFDILTKLFVHYSESRDSDSKELK